MNYLPVLVDKFITDTSERFVRCSYFTVECEEPQPGWAVEYNNKRLPVFLIGLRGIIWKPLGRGKYFNTRLQVQKLFHEIEQNKLLLVELDEILIPTSLFQDTKVYRGQVYRVRDDLFQIAYKYRTDRISKKEFYRMIDEFSSSDRKSDNITSKKPLLWLSEKESKSFMEWENVVVEEARAIQDYADIARKTGENI